MDFHELRNRNNRLFSRILETWHGDKDVSHFFMNKLQESQHIERKLTLELENQKETLFKERRNLIDLETDLTYRQQRLKKGGQSMSLNMYLGEVQNQTQSMNAVCVATIQAMEQAIQSIDTFATDTVLQGQTYSSAKIFFCPNFSSFSTRYHLFM